jgi:hypothetical protein
MGDTGFGRLGWRDGFVAASRYGMPLRPVLRLVGDQALASPPWTARLRGYSLKVVAEDPGDVVVPSVTGMGVEGMVM